MSDPSSTLAVQLAALKVELTAVKAAKVKAVAGMAAFSVEGVSKTSWSITELNKEQTRIEKAIQRIVSGGRGIVVDLSAMECYDEAIDPYGINGGIT